jgi:hypothetical protein
MSFAVHRAWFHDGARYSMTLAGNWRRAADGERGVDTNAAKRQATPQAAHCALYGRWRKPEASAACALSPNRTAPRWFTND